VQISPLTGVERLGGPARRQTDRAAAALAFLGRLVLAPADMTATAWGYTTRTIVQQIRFTAAQALPLVATIAVLVGGSVILQAYAQAVRLGAADVTARLLVSIVIRELGPLITAMVVLGRSGTAIAAEMATNTVLGETEAVEAFGVDPVHAFVMPRTIGLAVSAVVLTVYFDVISFASGIIAARVLADMALGELLESLRVVISLRDVVATCVKAAAFGAGIALISSYSGLTVRPNQPTDVPRAVTAAVVLSLLFIFGLSAVVTLVTYR
jgi:phospholipid/cholesterol/gamma-HCH transport system permease protein